MYFYYQSEGGNENWKLIKENRVHEIQSAMFRTILSIDGVVSEDASKADYDNIKYKGPLYFDLDDSSSPSSTAFHARSLVDKLTSLGVNEANIEIFASGGKGFHVLVPMECFIPRVPNTGIQFLPAIYREMAFNLAVDSMDFTVYSARKGRMLRQPNVLRPNGLYKVPVTYDELDDIAALDAAEAEKKYKKLCSTPRDMQDLYTPSELEVLRNTTIRHTDGLMAEYDLAKSKISKIGRGRKKKGDISIPKELPSFKALLEGKGVNPDVGFHTIALQAAITAHAMNLSKEDLLSMSVGLCENHVSDGSRYSSPKRRRLELSRLWDYTQDNPCYEYSPTALISVLSHKAPDVMGVPMTSEEIETVISDEDSSRNSSEDTDEFGHANIYLTNNGAFTIVDDRPKKLTSISFKNVVELVSMEDGKTSVIEADVYSAGKKVSEGTNFELDSFNSVSGINKMLMRHGQTFSGNDVQARGIYLRMIERARKEGKRMYISTREGLDLVKVPGHDSEQCREGFIIWSDNRGVSVPADLQDKIKMRFSGFPEVDGMFKTDLDDAPKLPSWLEEGNNREDMRLFLNNLISCQSLSHVGKLLGWMTASFWRMLFHAKYNKFPLLHINGAAGQGKTETTLLFANMHYYKSEPKMLTPSSTIFAVTHSLTGSCSIPLVLDEFKPGEMNQVTYDKFKLMLRDAYNCRALERGGGTRDSADYRSIHRSQLSAPIIFISESAESETALMERVVLLTQIKPPLVQCNENFKNFIGAVGKKHYLGILGKYIASSIVFNNNLNEFAEEFNKLYEEARYVLMLNPDAKVTKLVTKERTVFNYAVIKFGLEKFDNLISSVYGNEFKDKFAKMHETLYNTITDIQSQTIPEWLKVLNTFTDMAHMDSNDQSFLVKGKDYDYVIYNGKECIELNLRSCYHKYRMYMAASRSSPLFPGEASFMYAINNVPALEVSNFPIKLSQSSGSFILSLDELRAGGFVSP